MTRTTGRHAEHRARHCTDPSWSTSQVPAVVGVAHYAYAATVHRVDGAPSNVQGRWTEVYVRQDGRWQMVAVSGQPDERAEVPRRIEG